MPRDKRQEKKRNQQITVGQLLHLIELVKRPITHPAHYKYHEFVIWLSEHSGKPFASRVDLLEVFHRLLVCANQATDAPDFISRDVLQAFLEGKAAPLKTKGNVKFQKVNPGPSVVSPRREPFDVMDEDMTSMRVIQARRCWYKDFGSELGFDNFEDYLATIPPVPKHLWKHDPDFPLLVLIEPRLGLAKTCELIGIEFDGDDETFEPYDERHTDPQEPKWIRIHDGRRNHDRKPSACPNELKAGEFSGTDLAGVCCYLHYPNCVREGEHVMDLPGSVSIGCRGGCAILEVWDGRARLRWYYGGYAGPPCGAASCRE